MTRYHRRPRLRFTLRLIVDHRVCCARRWNASSRLFGFHALHGAGRSFGGAGAVRLRSRARWSAFPHLLPSCPRHASAPAKRLRMHPEFPRHLGDRWRLAQAQCSAPELLAKRLRSSPLHATVLPRISIEALEVSTKPGELQSAPTMMARELLWGSPISNST